MAGPSASVIVKTPLSEIQLGQIEDLVRSKAELIQGKDFWIQGHPFSWEHGEEYPGELSECDLQSHIGWQPDDQVILVAMSNDNESHRILAELCVEFARMLDGLIEFGGALRLCTEPTIGQVWEYEYESVSGISVAHLGTPEFLGWWLKQPNFRMVK